MVYDANTQKGMCCVLVLMSLFLVVVEPKRIFYVTEESPVGTLLGDLTDAIDLPLNSDLRIINLEEPGVSAFQLRTDSDTGATKLFVSSRLDREAICPRDLSRAHAMGSQASGRRPTSSSCSEVRPDPMVGYRDTPLCCVMLLISSGEAMLRVQVIVEDINDNMPMWDRSIIPIMFKDGDEIGAKRQIPRAYDPDLGRNGTIRYTLLSDGNTKGDKEEVFALVEANDGLYLQALTSIDREKQDNYTLILEARDEGHGSQQKSRVTLQVSVEDINDNTPQFTQSEFSNTEPIPETIAVGQVVLNLTAIDRDAGNNGRFHFDFSPPISQMQRLTSAQIYFRVNRNGQIVVKQPLDVDSGPSKFSFKVRVTDEAVPPYARSSEASVVLTVSDQNDEKPSIFMRYIVPKDPHTGYPVMLENVPSNRIVAMVEVTDADYRGQDTVECSIDNRNFTLVHTSSGTQGKRQEWKLLTGTMFDRETKPEQKVSIKCTDKGGHTTIENATIKIGDVNDNAPQFHQAIFTMDLRENSPAGTSLEGYLRAIDADEGLNAQIEYRVSPENAHNFSVDSRTGQLKARVPFDREAGEHYRLKVLAVDRGKPRLTGTGTVQVIIKDVNDNAPKFAKDPYHFQIPENRPHRTKVGTVSATDADSSENTRITYSMGPEKDAGHFYIDSISGAIFSRSPLDRELRSHYTFTVVANDNGIRRSGTSIGFSCSTTVNVIVLDQNDNDPVFIRPNATMNKFEVEAGKTLGHKLDYILAEDADSGDNGRVSYSIVAGNTESLFNLDSQTGLLFLDASLNSRHRSSSTGDQPFYLLVLKACDHGVPPRCATFSNLRIVVVERGAGSNDWGERGTESRYGDIEGGGNEAVIVVCLAVIFAVLVLATVVLICLLKRNRNFWSARNTTAGRKTNANTDPNAKFSAVLSPMQGISSDSSLRRKGIDKKSDDDSLLQLKMSRCSTLDSRIRRGDRQHPLTAAEYQTLDGLCLATTGGRYATSRPHPTYRETPLSTAPLHTYYEISSPSQQGLYTNASLNVDDSRLQYNLYNPLLPTNFKGSRSKLDQFSEAEHPLVMSQNADSSSTPCLLDNVTSTNKKSTSRTNSDTTGGGIYAPHKYTSYLATYREASFV